MTHWRLAAVAVTQLQTSQGLPTAQVCFLLTRPLRAACGSVLLSSAPNKQALSWKTVLLKLLLGVVQLTSLEFHWPKKVSWLSLTQLG